MIKGLFFKSLFLCYNKKGYNNKTEEIFYVVSIII